ncbi:substrate-binding periplasmic protein [Chitinimonas naiadis]
MKLWWPGACWLALALMAQAETLRIGFGTNKPPYIFEAEKRGLEYDIIEQAAIKAGFTVVPFFAPMERLHRMQQTSQLDAIATTNEQSHLPVYYSMPYIEYRNYAVALSARRLDIRQIADLGRYSVSSFQRARELLGPEFMAMAAGNPQYREEAQQIIRNRLLLSGRVDVIVGDRRIIEYFNHEMGGQVNVNQPLSWYALFPPTPYQLGFRTAEQRDRFDAGLEALRRSGEYAAIEKRYAIY